MDDYETLLIELGEKSENTWTSGLSVEVRLIGMVFFQAAVFWLLKSVGGPAAGLLSVVLGKKPINNIVQNQEPQEEKKMKGPSFRK